MIGYTLVGSNDLETASQFYDRIFAAIGVARGFAIPERMITWGKIWQEPHFGVVRPYDQQPANVGNGSMIAFKAATRAEVDALHAAALAAGGRDEGPPGMRGPGPDGFYGAYFRDLDGNKLCVFIYGPPT